DSELFHSKAADAIVSGNAKDSALASASDGSCTSRLFKSLNESDCCANEVKEIARNPAATMRARVIMWQLSFRNPSRASEIYVGRSMSILRTQTRVAGKSSHPRKIISTFVLRTSRSGN